MSLASNKHGETDDLVDKGTICNEFLDSIVEQKAAGDVLLFCSLSNNIETGVVRLKPSAADDFCVRQMFFFQSRVLYRHLFFAKDRHMVRFLFPA